MLFIFTWRAEDVRQETWNRKVIDAPCVFFPKLCEDDLERGEGYSGWTLEMGVATKAQQFEDGAALER